MQVQAGGQAPLHRHGQLINNKGPAGRAPRRADRPAAESGQKQTLESQITYTGTPRHESPTNVLDAREAEGLEAGALGEDGGL